MTVRPLPPAMVEPPRLPRDGCIPELRPHHALLLNPFYAKDPHASFGKHVLTPSLALTSVAGSTPEHWTVDFWDERFTTCDAEAALDTAQVFGAKRREVIDQVAAQVIWP